MTSRDPIALGLPHRAPFIFIDEVLELAIDNLIDIRLEDDGCVLITHATHLTRGAITIVQPFPGNRVLIFGRQAMPTIAAA